MEAGNSPAVFSIGAASLVIHWISSLLIIRSAFWLFSLSVETWGDYQPTPKYIRLSDLHELEMSRLELP